MSINTLHGTAAPNKPSVFDPWFAGWVLAAIQDRKYLDGLPLDQRDKTTKALSDLEQLQQLPEGRARDAMLDGLAEYFARRWAPKGEIKIALEKQAETEGKPRRFVKHEAIRYGLFIALTEISRVQKVQLGQTRDTVVVDDGVLVLCTSDDGVRDWAAGLAHEGHFEKLLRPRSAVMAAFLGYDSWMKDAKDCVWAASVGPTRPVDLRAEHRLHWLRRRAIRLAEAWLLDEPDRLARRTSDAMQRAAPLPEHLAASPDETTRLEDLQEARWLASALVDRASARERELLRFLWMHPDSPAGEIAVELGVAPATIRVMKGNLRKKVIRLTS